MKALVVHESLFGNTAQVAQAINRALSEHLDVELVEVSKAPPVITEPVDLLVVGGPTQAFSMTRPATREDAFSQGASHGSKAVWVGEWLGSQRQGPSQRTRGDVRHPVGRVRHLPGSAAREPRSSPTTSARQQPPSPRAATSMTSRAACWRVSWIVHRPGLNGWGLPAGDRPVERPGDEGRVELVTGPCGGQHQRCPRPHRGPT
jgi:hypothetical protein